MNLFEWANKNNVEIGGRVLFEMRTNQEKYNSESRGNAEKAALLLPISLTVPGTIGLLAIGAGPIAAIVIGAVLGMFVLGFATTDFST